MIDTRIKDGHGSNRKLHINEDHAALTAVTGVPPVIVSSVLKPFSELMVDSFGTTSMLVDGSVDAQDFYIQASTEGDRYIHSIGITIADAGATFNKFGNRAALTNGCDLIYQDNEVGDVTIGSGLKSNFDFVQLCSFYPSFSGFKSSNVEGSSEAYHPILNFEQVYGLKYGLKLPNGSIKKLILRINDNVAGVDRFDIKAFGFDVITP